jgi:hypothetical protein
MDGRASPDVTDASRVDRAVVDADSPAACLPLVACNPSVPDACGASSEACSACVSLVAALATARNPTRRVSSACIRVQLVDSAGAGFNGEIDCDEPTFVSLVNDEPEWGGGECVRTEDCVALFNAGAGGVRPGETISRCRFADGTIARDRAPADAPRRCDAALGVCGPSCGCDAGRVCAFASQVAPTGVCVPPTSGNRRVSRPCRRMPNQMSCPSGEACLLPQRDNIDMPDRERWGVCMPTERCRAFHRYFQGDRPLFVCDESLTDRDAGT